MKFKLFKKVIEKSVANEWDDAKKEWKQRNIVHLQDGEESGECLCGKYPIRELVYLYNKLNQNEIIVGNCCINRFFDIKDFNKVFRAISENRVNSFMIMDTFKKSKISEWEAKFMLQLWRKRNLSYKQHDLFEKIKIKILSNYTTIQIKPQEYKPKLEKTYPDFKTFLREYRGE